MRSQFLFVSPRFFGVVLVEIFCRRERERWKLFMRVKFKLEMMPDVSMDIYNPMISVTVLRGV